MNELIKPANPIPLLRRCAGHTHAAINGVKNTDAILIVASTAQLNCIDLPAEKMVVMGRLHKLMGSEKPVVYDHYAVERMFTNYADDLERYYKKLYNNHE